MYITTGKKKKHLDDYGLVEYGYADITWDTTEVWLTREEGEGFWKENTLSIRFKR